MTQHLPASDNSGGKFHDEHYVSSRRRLQALLAELANWRRSGDLVLLSAAAALLVLFGTALLAPYLAPVESTRVALGKALLPPGGGHFLGTDLLGRDVLAMAISGARVSLSVGVGAAAASALLGVALGLWAAESRGVVDSAICRVVDAALAVPAYFVLVAWQAIVGPGLLNVILAISLVTWMPVARVVRALALSLGSREFVLAARALGCTGTRVTLRHIFPNAAPQIVVLFTLGVADALLMESALSFLGLGLPPTEPSWGNMLNGAQTGVLSGAWWVAIVPGALILVATLSINALGDRLGGLTRS